MCCRVIDRGMAFADDAVVATAFSSLFDMAAEVPGAPSRHCISAANTLPEYSIARHPGYHLRDHEFLSLRHLARTGFDWLGFMAYSDFLTHIFPLAQTAQRRSGAGDIHSSFNLYTHGFWLRV